MLFICVHIKFAFYVFKQNKSIEHKRSEQ